MPDVRLWLLGGFRAEFNGCPVTGFESDKARALLSYLALEARPLRREHIVGRLWPALPEARARGNLSRVLTNLRHLLPGLIQADRVEVDLDRSQCWIDAIAFETGLRATDQFPAPDRSAALQLYGGALLAGFSLPGCPDFEEWLRVQQERLHQLALTAHQHQLDYHWARGEFGAALNAAHRVLALEPWREATHRQIMLLLALQGQREAALRQYALCRRTLADELNVPLSAETDALYRRLIDGLDDRVEAAAAPAPELPFVGREADHAWLMARWTAARQRHGGLTLINGVAGIGKTRLVNQVVRPLLGQGCVVLTGRCYEFNRALPYQAIHEALRLQLARLTPVTRPALPAAIVNELSRLLPEVHTLWAEPANSAPPLNRDAAFEAVAALLRALTPRAGLVLFLDDLHWADADTLDLLHYLVRRFSDWPIWFVGVYRPEETPPDHPLARLSRALSRDEALVLRTLAPLSPAAVTQLAAGRHADVGLIDYLCRESDGNPLAITELIVSLQERHILAVDGTWRLIDQLPIAPLLPTRIHDMILQRVARLSDTSQYLLVLAAAYGQPFDLALLHALGDEDIPAVDDAVRDWQQRNLVRPAGAQLDVTHPKIRKALYGAVPPALRRLLHARLGEALEVVRADDAQLAHHWNLAQHWPKAVRYLLAAGDQARLSFAHDLALGYYARGLDIVHHHLPDQAAWQAIRFELLAGQEAIYNLQSRRTEQHAVLQVLAQMTGLAANPIDSPGPIDPARQAAVALRQARYAEAVGDYATAIQAAQTTINCAQTAGQAAQVAAAYWMWGYALRRLGHADQARQRYEQARDLAQAAQARDVLSDSLQGLANLAREQGRFAEACACLDQSLALCQALNDRRSEGDAYNNLGLVFYVQGDYTVARDYFERALTVRREISDRRGEGLTLINLGALALKTAAFDQAGELCRAGLALCDSVGEVRGAVIARRLLTQLASGNSPADSESPATR